MGQRFILARNLRPMYSKRRTWLRLNEHDFEPHRMRPYGLESKKFWYRSMWHENRQRPGNKLEDRYPKKVARQRAKHALRQEEEV